MIRVSVWSPIFAAARVVRVPVGVRAPTAGLIVALATGSEAPKACPPRWYVAPKAHGAEPAWPNVEGTGAPN